MATNNTAFLVFYRFKAMNKGEAERAKDEWQNLKNNLPSGIELVNNIYMHGELSTIVFVI